MDDMANQIEDLAGPMVVETVVPAHAAATATEIVPIFRAPFACKVRSVIYNLGGAITGDNTNRTNINLLNMGTGAGTTELANKDYATGTDGVTGVDVSLYAPATYLTMAAGTMLGLQLEKVGSGVAVPSFLCNVTYEAT